MWFRLLAVSKMSTRLHIINAKIRRKHFLNYQVYGYGGGLSLSITAREVGYTLIRMVDHCRANT